MPKGVRPQQQPGEFKQQVVEDVQKNKISYMEAMRKYGIKGKSSIARWERIYLEEGVEGLYVQRRGRPPMKKQGSPKKVGKLSPEVEEDLIAENQRLRAENAYLKNLHALVSERIRRESGRK